MIRIRESVSLQTRWLTTSLLWIGIAAALGLFVGGQSIELVFGGLAVGFFLVTMFMTPLAAIGIMLIIAPMRTLIATEANLQLPLDIGQYAFIVLLGVWVVYRGSYGGRFIRQFWSPLTIAVLVYLIVTVFTVFSAHSFSVWLTEWLKWVQILLLVLILQNVLSHGDWEWVLFGLVMAGLVNALIGIYEFLGGSGALHLLINDRFFRAFGTFGQPNPFGGFMGLLLPLTAMATWGYSVRTWKVLRALQHPHHRIPGSLVIAAFYGLATVVMLVGIVASWSRGAWIGLVCAVIVIIFAIPRRFWWSIYSFIGIIGLVAIVWFSGILPSSVVDRLSNSTQEFFAFEDVRGVDITPENYAVAERLAHWQAALNMATDHPWLGVGLGHYEVVYPQYRLINWFEPLGHAHNYYLNIFAEAGIIGLLAYGKVWIVIIALTWRTRSHPDILARFVSIGLLGSWSYLTIHSLFDNLYVNNLFLHLGLMLGILVVLHYQTRMGKRLEIT